jgi:TolB-like protein/DNA-binding winged helix-turn-helix (wHTH) protein/Tfp pilus assembly protein PilF
MTENLQQGFRLGEFAIHPLHGTASGPDGVHHVPPMAMEVLLCLAKAPGTIVTRRDLLSEVWGDPNASDEALTRCVSELRHQLGDHRELPSYIQTLPKRGYRLVAPVNELSTGESGETANAARDGPVSPASNSSATATPYGGLQEFINDLQRRRVFRVALVYLICAWLVVQVAEATFPALLIPPWAQTLVVVLTIFGFPIALVLAWAFQITPDGVTADTSSSYFNTLGDKRKIDYIIIATLVAVIGFLAFRQFSIEGTEPSTTSDEITAGDLGSIGAPAEQVASIAVLPFVNMSDNAGNEYFSDGLSEEILNSLTRLKELKVAARTSSFYFKNKDADIPTIGLHLGVRHVLEGSVRRQGQRVRITAQLIRADTGFHVWSETYDREVENVFDIQSDIARNVAEALELVLSGESGAQLARRATTSLDAYEYYLQARSYLRAPEGASTLASAEALFKKALAIDVDYAEAYAGLCDTYLIDYEDTRSTKLFEKAERACHRALTLDSAAGDVHTALGNLYRNSGQYHKAEQNFKRAIALNASAAEAYDGLAETYQQQNRLDEAEDVFQRAIEIQPSFWRGHLAMGNFLFSAGRSAEAIEYFRRVTDLTPDNAVGHLNLGTAYYMIGDFENAATAWRRSVDLHPSHIAYANIGSSYFFLGRFQEAIEMYQRATEMAPDDYEAWGALGDACRFAEGQTELATSAYKKAIELAEDVLSVNPSDPDATAQLAHYYANIDEPERARPLVARALKLAPQSMYVCYDAAVTNVSLGEADKALTAIEQAVELGYPVELLSVDAGLAPLMETDRFKTLLAKQEN